ncbi:MAG: hypothetical protein JO179_22570 [Solirubrobacterales bacterium]|nr:hypothetical protein [Solirubrobacterales bacterium]
MDDARCSTDNRRCGGQCGAHPEWTGLLYMLNPRPVRLLESRQAVAHLACDARSGHHHHLLHGGLAQHIQHVVDDRPVCHVLQGWYGAVVGQGPGTSWILDNDYASHLHTRGTQHRRLYSRRTRRLALGFVRPLAQPLVMNGFVGC